MFPVGEETTFEQLAETSGLREGELARVLRHAMTKHIFHEPREGVVEHTAGSRLLAQDEAFVDWVDVNLRETWPAAAQVRLSHTMARATVRLIQQDRRSMPCGSGLTLIVQHRVYVPRSIKW